MAKIIGGFDPESYATVAERIRLFYAAHPLGRIHTELVTRTAEAVVFKASDLASIADPAGNWFRYTYDGASRVDSLLIGPSGGNKSIWETHVYDPDGRQTRRTRSTAASSLFDELFWFDAQGRPTKVWRATAANGRSPDTTRFVYSGLGAVQARERIDQFGNWESEEYRVDALGNNLESRDGGTNNHGVQDPRYWQYSFHGELAARNTYQPQQAEEWFKQGFDGDGNVAYRFLVIHRLSGNYEADDQVRNYYDAANRLRAVQHYNFPGVGDTHGTFDEYEYDALGRRIVVVSRRHENLPACTNGATCCETATVILNRAGEVVTTWARSSAGWRIHP